MLYGICYIVDDSHGWHGGQHQNVTNTNTKKSPPNRHRHQHQMSPPNRHQHQHQNVTSKSSPAPTPKCHLQIVTNTKRHLQIVTNTKTSPPNRHKENCLVGLVALKNFPPWLKRKCLAVAQHTGTHAHILTHSYTHTHTHTHIPTTYIHACPSQLQRLAVARALCARPAPTVLVMDEALGSVPEQDEVS